jgi:RsiW-degrading membrane proteinase PrsW (M82 family)
VTFPVYPPSPWLPTKISKVGAPLGVILAMGTVTGLILVLITAVNPVGAVLGFVLTTAAIIVVLLAYLWLDRWEPEPPRLLVLAFLWGASVAIVVSILLELATDAVLGPGLGADSPGSPLTIAVGAPLIEEAAKGLFLLVMLTGRRRNEMNSLTDCLVYAGVTAAGFAWIEDNFYIANAETLGASLATAALRLVLAPFAHPLFTTFTAIGVYFALQRRSTAAKAACILLGYAGAALMHGLWNGSALIGAKAYFGVYLLWMLPIFVLAVILAVYSRRLEQHVVASKLPGMVAAGVVTPNEATWLGTIRDRKLAVATATRFGGKPAGRSVHEFAVRVVGLAFVRDRIDRGFGDQRSWALLNEEAYRVHAARAASPALGGLAYYRAP